ncbi:MAG: type 4a pilus biogenesis protein PilO [Chthonomonas sp.]|nr:type 4a pilus biogenesis protein PilO [Chthonomonas sp.]
MNTSKRMKVFAILAAVAVVTGSGANYWLMSERGSAASKRDEIKKQIQDEDDVAAKQLKIRTEVEESQQFLDHLEANVAENAYIPTLVTELETLGNAKGLTITGVKPKRIEEKKVKVDPNASEEDKKKAKKKQPAKKPYDEWQIEVNATGFYPAILDFINSLQEFSKIVEVYTVGLNELNGPEKKYGPDGSPQLELTLTLKAYAFPEKDNDRSDSTNEDTNNE